jgi:hypothetical protein
LLYNHLYFGRDKLHLMFTLSTRKNSDQITCFCIRKSSNLSFYFILVHGYKHFALKLKPMHFIYLFFIFGVFCLFQVEKELF